MSDEPSNNSGTVRPPRRSQRYPFWVEKKEYHIHFLPMTYLDGYDDEDLARLAATDAWEITFMLEHFVMPDGTVAGGYGTTRTGTAFRVLGGVTNFILGWAQRNRPQYLYWYAQGSRRQRLYDRMIVYPASRGSPWQRLEVDPITGMLCASEAFWLVRSPSPTPPHKGR
jgi:hypothetical protein